MQKLEMGKGRDIERSVSQSPQLLTSFMMHDIISTNIECLLRIQPSKCMAIARAFDKIGNSSIAAMNSGFSQ
jgi:hypothetical protein